MDNWEIIEAYLQGRLPAEGRAAFETRLAVEPDLADQVAFYLQAQATARRAALVERHAEWQTLSQPAARQTRVIRIGYASVASLAAMLLLVAGWWGFFRQPDASPEQLADAYIQQNFKTLSVQMSGDADSLQTALNLANQGKNKQALAQLTDLVRRDSANAEAKRYAGIVALRAGKYDEAIGYFHALSQQPELFSNAGAFLEALARLKRGQPLDRNQAKELLQTVVRENLEGKEEAAKWLEHWK